jgi:dihydrolipoamide dehydrogenase
MVVGEPTLDTQLLVIGSGPGGYAAAFRAADLGLDVTMISLERKPGGVCLYQGCIPSKTLLHLAQLLYDAQRATAMGLTFGQPQIDLAQVRAWKDQVIGKLTGGLVNLSKRRDVQFITARAAFDSSDRVRLEGADLRFVRFEHAIVATGSHPIPFPGVEFREGGRVMDSTAALALPDVPETLLVVGGGYVGLELGSVYAALGSKVTLVELTDGLLPGADRDLVKILARRLDETFAEIRLNTKVVSLTEHADHVDVTLEGANGPERRSFDRVLVAMGRRPNSAGMDLEATGVKLDGRGFIQVDEQQRTADPKILAIGDVVGGAMLAHKAMREGKVAAEVIAGQPSAFDVRAIPCVVFTDPQVAWCGLTEADAARQGRKIEIARFPWGASGRATTLDAPEGLTKLVFDPETKQVLGMGIVGREAGELIAEGVLAVEMAAQADDLALSMHPHPTLSETEGEAAEAFLGSATHILPPKHGGG